ncbi:redoxin domain-containing protein [Planctomicrobium piriforme]|uniref:Peroxiredoxin n=1 Tax=Planctomicrobium piriforme TaxID=1576369 RepID=A0A1I3GMI2_9PLAN|nr:redoxin domain-containing protein [Planctomicrobium piriforme]SFI24705.1 Peroxiredoxin [Planctomicrobium piriforme]
MTFNRWYCQFIPMLAVAGMVLLGAISPAIAQPNPNGQLPVFELGEPYLLLIRDPVVQRELKLSDEQQQALDAFNETLDGPLLSTRNQPNEQANKAATEMIAQSRAKLATILMPDQQTRLLEIERWVQGLRSLLRPDVSERLSLSDKQQEQIREIIDDYVKQTNGIKEKVSSGEPLGPLEKQNSELQVRTQKTLQKLLKPEQRKQWLAMLGKPLDSKSLGKVRFKAPELLGDGPWVNSRPLTMEGLRGKVVALHFFTFGCINCIHNYQAYHNWEKQFAGKDVVLLGIHTPEVSNEHDVEMLKKKMSENNFAFPVLVDNESQNWNAWGNSMWPTVYLIDKQGDVRYWWTGELNWEGQTGEKQFAKHIEELLAE